VRIPRGSLRRALQLTAAPRRADFPFCNPPPAEELRAELDRAQREANQETDEEASDADVEIAPRNTRVLRSATASPTKSLRTPTTPFAPSPMSSRPASNEASARRDAKKRVMERRDSRLLKHGARVATW